MSQDTTIGNLRNCLVNEIRASMPDETILSAFQIVPRHVFVPSFLDHVPGRKNEWRRISLSSDPEEWLEKVYTNRPLTISVDEYGYPTSSSSQPDLMALMMQSVQILPGDHVLEIGTGTGYNAALLAALVGPSHVTSIEINETLIKNAQARIERTIGPGVRIIHADGRHLPAECNERFDVLIVTGAHERLETSWMRALKPGGKLVFNWIKSFARVMLEAKKLSNGNISGQVCQYGGDFMGLHNGDGIVRNPLPHQELELVEHIMFPDYQLLEDADFRFFLQINLPMRHSTYHSNHSKGGKIYVIRDSEDNRIAQLGTAAMWGDTSLIGEICAVAQAFEQLGRPCCTMFAFTADAEGSMNFTLKGAESPQLFTVRGLQGSYS
jgi:protein-L-isoaspartate O-methyltransferase